jgi:hypothetical protein
MEDAITELGRRIIETSRLAVAMHLEAVRAGQDLQPIPLNNSAWTPASTQAQRGTLVMQGCAR